MIGQLQFANGMAGAENLDFINYYYSDVSPVKLYEPVKEKTQPKSETPRNYEDFMLYADSIPGYGVNKKRFRTIVNYVNKHNPATSNLRNGILASMRLNTNNIARNLRWSYITPDEAKQKDLDMEQWKKIVVIRQKLDNLFYTAGGRPENLKTIILNGRGNLDNTIAGLNDFKKQSLELSELSSLKELLGLELYGNENPYEHTMYEPLKTANTLDSAKGVIDVFTKMIKKIGDGINGVFSGNAALNGNQVEDKFSNFFKNIFDIPTKEKSETEPDASTEGLAKDDANKADEKTASLNPPVIKTRIISKAKSFFNQHKKWFAVAAIGLIGIAAINTYAYYAKQKGNGVGKETRKTYGNHRVKEMDELLVKTEKLSPVELG